MFDFNNNNKSNGKSIIAFIKKHWLSILSILYALFVLVLIIFIVIAVIVAPTSLVEEFRNLLSTTGDELTSFREKIGNFFSGNGYSDDSEAAAKAEIAYFDKLENVYENYLDKGINIDITMITATLFYGRSMGDYDVIYSASDTISSNADDNDYDITNIGYNEEVDFYKEAKKHIALLAKYQVVETETTTYCDGSHTSDSYPSMKDFAESGAQKIRIFKQSDDAGDPSCKEDVSTSKTTDISREGAYYYRLLSNQTVGFLKKVNFIKDYYFPDEDVSEETMIEMVENIYGLYESVHNDSGFTINSTLCPGGITVEGLGTLSLDEYVAGVVEAENNVGSQAMRAQAIAARTYAVNATNKCRKSISNSTAQQTYKQPGAEALKASQDTVGMVLTYNGEVFSSQYDAFCPQTRSCSGSLCTATYTRIPSGETHVITAYSSSGAASVSSGHCNGMSQYGARYLEQEKGYNYEQILKYFYADNVEITLYGSSTSISSEVINGSVGQKLAFLFPTGIPTTSAEASAYMKTVSVPVVDINGNKSTKNVTLHKALADDFVKIMTEISNMGFPIKSVGCYNWRNAAASSSRSHHSYGVACDLNPTENYMIKNGSIVSGSYWRPASDPYSFAADGVVVKTFEKYGWGWGGSWNSSKDYMHFSFTGY